MHLAVIVTLKCTCTYRHAAPLPFRVNITWSFSIRFPTKQQHTKLPRNFIIHSVHFQIYNYYFQVTYIIVKKVSVIAFQVVMGSLDNHHHDLENGNTTKPAVLSVPLLGTECDPDHVLSSVRGSMFKDFVANVRKVLFETKLLVLFPAIPMAFAAHYYNLERVSVVQCIC